MKNILFVMKDSAFKKVLCVLYVIFVAYGTFAGDSNLTILFTHDIQGHWTPTYSVQNNEVIYGGGVTRMSTIIKEERAKDSELLLVDAGDYSMGTLFQTIFSTHSPQLHILGEIGFDVATLGNHDFNFRASGLAQSLMAAKQTDGPLPELVLANTVFPTEESKMTPSLAELQHAFAEYPVKEYVVVNKNGYRIAIFGLIGENAASYAPMAEVDFENYIESAKRVVAHIKKNETVDMIMCLSHSGTSDTKEKSEDEILAKRVSGIDIIVSGHSHTTLTEPIRVGKTLIISSGAYARKIGKIVVRKTDKRWDVEQYELIELNESIPEDPDLLTDIGYFKQLVNEEYLTQFGFDFDEVLAYCPYNFTPAIEIGTEHREEPLGTLIANGYRYAVKQLEGEKYEPIAVTFVPRGLVRGSFVKGDITVSDVFLVSSIGVGKDSISGYPLLSVYLTGKELKMLCEVDASIQPLMSSAQLYISGLVYTFNPNRFIFNRVTDVAVLNEQGFKVRIDDKKLYRVVTGLYSGQMLPVVKDRSLGILSFVPKTKDGTPIVDLENHIIYINRDGKQVELKEWASLAQYLQAFPKIDGKPVVSNYYSQPHGLKNIDTSTAFVDIVRSPNLISLGAYVFVILVFLLFAFVISKMLFPLKKRY